MMNTSFKSRKKDPRLKELLAKGSSRTPEEEVEFQALFAFKNNPRGAELFKKSILGTCTPEEKAELEALFAFGDNSRGVELLKKSILGTCTPEEKAELEALFAAKRREKR